MIKKTKQLFFAVFFLSTHIFSQDIASLKKELNLLYDSMFKALDANTKAQEFFKKTKQLRAQLYEAQPELKNLDKQLTQLEAERCSLQPKYFVLNEEGYKLYKQLISEVAAEENKKLNEIYPFLACAQENPTDNPTQLASLQAQHDQLMAAIDAKVNKAKRSSKVGERLTQIQQEWPELQQRVIEINKRMQTLANEQTKIINSSENLMKIRDELSDADTYLNNVTSFEENITFQITPKLQQLKQKSDKEFCTFIAEIEQKMLNKYGIYWRQL